MFVLSLRKYISKCYNCLLFLSCTAIHRLFVLLKLLLRKWKSWFTLLNLCLLKLGFIFLHLISDIAWNAVIMSCVMFQMASRKFIGQFIWFFWITIFKDEYVSNIFPGSANLELISAWNLYTLVNQLSFTPLHIFPLYVKSCSGKRTLYGARPIRKKDHKCQKKLLC